MYKVIGADQKPYGPVTAELLRQWIAEGRINAQTSVLPDGATDWQPLATFPEFADALQAQTGAPPAAAALPPLDPEAWTAQILAQPTQLQIGRCLARSWQLLTANAGLLCGATALIWLIRLVLKNASCGLGDLLLNGVLLGGLSLVFLKRIRGQAASVSDAFAGFSLAFGQLLLTGLVSNLLSGVGVCFCLLPGVYLFVAWRFAVPLVADKRLEFWSAMELSRKVVTRVWFPMLGLLVLAFLPFLLSIVMVQIATQASTTALVRDLVASGDLDFAHLFQVTMRIFWANILYVLASQFVLLLNLPFALGALMYAYEDLFGPRTTPSA